MADFVTPPVVTDPGELFDEMVAILETAFPGWEPSDGDPMTWLLEGDSQITAQLMETGSETLTSLFVWFGKFLSDVPPIEAVAATALATFTAIDTAGYPIPAGTTIAIDVGGGQLVGFRTTSDATIDPGDLTVTGVTVAAVEPGADANGLTGTAGLVDSLAYLTAVTLTTTSADGVDAEPDDVYRSRLRATLQLQTDTPILPRDSAEIAKKIATVERALALDGYDPGDHASYDPDDPATWKERVHTIAPIQADGSDVSGGTSTALDVLFNGDGGDVEGLRETNFVFFVVDPTRTLIDVTFTALAWPGWVAADVEAAAEQAVTDYLSAALWGQPAAGEKRAWLNNTKVTLGSLYGVLATVEGLRNVTALTFAKHGNALASSDVTLDGAPGPVLPTPNIIDGTVTAS